MKNKPRRVSFVDDLTTKSKKRFVRKVIRRLEQFGTYTYDKPSDSLRAQVASELGLIPHHTTHCGPSISMYSNWLEEYFPDAVPACPWTLKYEMHKDGWRYEATREFVLDTLLVCFGPRTDMKFIFNEDVDIMTLPRLPKGKISRELKGMYVINVMGRLYYANVKYVGGKPKVRQIDYDNPPSGLLYQVMLEMGYNTMISLDTYQKWLNEVRATIRRRHGKVSSLCASYIKTEISRII